ncbi:uroporphyrinogen-III synthase [Ornithinibacillus halophilus]|uniref:uroporphyrinogen-III synthase n=1 Tax=Ornithinibacillus halophilus TaxID=930117 RepID=UPI001F3BCA9E|nr:uroporphyrinogen-III synthase [Ornithinibacillus halophilus]
MEKKVLITREKSQAKVFTEKVKAEGGIPIEVPLLKIECMEPKEYIDIQNYQWIFFTSTNGVHCFFKNLDKSALSLMKSVRIAAVGNKTEEAIQQYGFNVHFLPEQYTADSMTDTFLTEYPEPGTILLVRGNRSRDVLPEFFTKRNVNYDSIEVYETVHNIESKLMEALNTHSFDFITFTSPSTVEAFVKSHGQTYINNDPVIVCIGTTTEAKAKQVGFERILVADTFTVDGMIEAMINFNKRS